MEHILGLLVGIGLSAACGFRIFVPLLGINVASLSGHLTLAPGFEWIGSWPALVAFGTATLAEVGGYYIPWVDNLLDAAATPVAVVAATILTASQVGEMSPFLKWSLAAVAGGGVAGTVQAGTVALRAASTGTTGGLGNFLVATFELFTAALVTILAIVVPVLCFVMVIAVLALIIVRLIKLTEKRAAAPVLLAATERPAPNAERR
jgi:hypothetical protein